VNKFDIARGQYTVLDAFDELTLSGDVRIVKPDPEILKLLIAGSALPTTSHLPINLVSPRSTSTRRAAAGIAPWACHKSASASSSFSRHE
jgi:hypothetical protein